jgi:diguanylate cyclase (GGDEF)-like protein
MDTSAATYALIAISNTSRGASLRRLVADALRVDVVVVRDGDAALHEIAGRGAPIALLVDPSLPRIDGFTVIRNVRRQSARIRTRIIVMSAHDSLRTAARELSSSLEIATILPLDAGPQDLETALDIVPQTGRLNGEEPLAACSPERLAAADELIDRAAADVRRRFGVPASLGYLRLSQHENSTFHVSAAGSTSKIAIGDVDVALLRQVAGGTEPLVIPDVESHGAFSRLTVKHGPPVRSFAAVPVPTNDPAARAALCILDAEPLKLVASDLDAFAAFSRQVGHELDHIVEPDRQATRDTGASDDFEALQYLASTDPLTGLANRRGGERHIAREISRARREQRPLSCILIDIDRFKQVNDTFGHQAGDQLLRDVSTALRGSVRAYDILVRWGGDEFLAVLPGVALEAARTLAERIRRAIEALDTHGMGPVTISAGASSFDKNYDFFATLNAADRRLYEAKAAGRNCAA